MKKSSFLAGLILGILICLAVIMTAGYFIYDKYISSLQAQQPQLARTAAAQEATNVPAYNVPQSPADVIEALNKMIQIRPNDPNAYLQKADILAELGAHAEALENYNIAATLAPNNPQIYLNRAMAKFALNDFAGSSRDLSAAIQINPELAKAYYNRGVANVNLSQIKLAAQDFAKARDLFAKQGDSNNFNDAGKALKTVNEFISAVPSKGKRNQAQSKQVKQNPKELVSMKRDDTSSVKNKSALTASLNNTDTKGMLEKFRNASAQADGSQPALGDLSSYAAAASQTLAQKQQDMPKNTLDYRMDAQKKLASGDYAGAGKDLDRAIALSPDDSNLYAQRGMANAAQQDSESAISDFSKAISLNPKNASAYFNRAQQRSTMGDTKGALQDLKAAGDLYDEQDNKKGKQQAENLANTLQGKTVKTTKNDSEAERLLKQGTNDYSEGKYESALKNFNELIKRQPKVPELYYNRAITNSAVGKYDDALKDYKAAIAGNPKMPDAYIGAAGVLLQQGKAEEAKTNIAKAIELNPENPSAYRMRAMQLAQEGDNKNAMNDFNQALSLDPQDGASYLSRGILKAQDNNLEQARQDMLAAVELGEKQGNDKLLKEGQKYLQMIEQAMSGSSQSAR